MHFSLWRQVIGTKGLGPEFLKHVSRVDAISEKSVMTLNS